MLVVNLSEGEPASSKDAALALTRPHLVIDGAVAAARALHAPASCTSCCPATGRRRPPRCGPRSPSGTTRCRCTPTSPRPRFVAGQAKAVVELLAGRPNLPVTTWRPDAVAGHQGRPTLLSNAETWARLGLLVLRGEREYAAVGTRDEPGPPCSR